MSNPRTEADLRDEISRLEASDARLALQLDDLDQRRTDVEGERKRNARRAAAARDELHEILQEPAARAELEDLVRRLRARLSLPPEYPADSRSATRQNIARELDALPGDARRTTAQKVSHVRQLARNFAERRTLDAQAWKVAPR